MRAYLFINRELNILLNDKELPSNHLDVRWNDFFGQLSYVVYTHTENIFKINHMTAEYIDLCTSYLVELEIPEDIIISRIAYSDYRLLTQYLPNYKKNVIAQVYDRAKTGLKYSNFNTIIINRISRSMIKKVYRQNSVEPYWIEAYVEGNKLIHKIR